MFKSKKNASSTAAKANPTSVVSRGGESNCNVIAKGTKIEGTIRSQQSMRVDGEIKGDVVCQQKFIMGEEGLVTGNVECAESSIRGKVDGILKVKGLLHLLETAHLEGKIMAKKMVVDEGAGYSGECLIGEKHVN